MPKYQAQITRHGHVHRSAFTTCDGATVVFSDEGNITLTLPPTSTRVWRKSPGMGCAGVHLSEVCAAGTQIGVPETPT